MKQITGDMLPALIRKTMNKEELKPMGFTLPPPYHLWQKMLINSDVRIMVFPCATKVGKTLGGTSRLLSHSFRAEKELDTIFRTIAPTTALTRITYQYLNRLIPENLPAYIDHPNFEEANHDWRGFTPHRSEHKGAMQWQHNNSRIQCIHGSDPEVTIEGERVHGNCFDEAAKLKRQVFDSAMSTTAQTGGWNCLYGTPRGKNWYYELFMEAREHMRWAHKNSKPLEMFAMQARTMDNPFVPRESIARAKKHLPDRIFRQLYMAEFLDDGSVFAGHRDCTFGEEISFDEDIKIQQWIHPEADKCEVVIGTDWAKREDYYVSVAFDINHNPPRMVGFQRATHVNYTSCVGLLYKFSQKFKDVITCRHDRTGVGDVIDELIQPLPFPIEPVVFTNAVKTSMVEKYMVALESKDVLLPNWVDMIKEHDNFDVTTTSTGLQKYAAMEGEHDDIIMALCLAYYGVWEMREKDFSVKILQELPDKRLEMEKGEVDYLNGLIEQFEDEDDSNGWFL